jgi:hypothetical protein
MCYFPSSAVIVINIKLHPVILHHHHHQLFLTRKSSSSSSREDGPSCWDIVKSPAHNPWSDPVVAVPEGLRGKLSCHRGRRTVYRRFANTPLSLLRPAEPKQQLSSDRITLEAVRAPTVRLVDAVIRDNKRSLKTSTLR